MVEGPPSLNFFLQKVHFVLFLLLFFPGDVLLFQTQILIFNVFLNFSNYVLYFHHRTQALCKSFETIDDIKLDSSSETDSSSENTYSFSEENCDNVTFYRWQIVEKKITKSKVDVTFKDVTECLKMTSKQ